MEWPAQGTSTVPIVSAHFPSLYLCTPQLLTSTAPTHFCADIQLVSQPSMVVVISAHLPSPRTRTTVGDRSFAVAGPRVCGLAKRCRTPGQRRDSRPLDTGIGRRDSSAAHTSCTLDDQRDRASAVPASQHKISQSGRRD